MDYLTEPMKKILLTLPLLLLTLLFAANTLADKNGDVNLKNSIQKNLFTN